MGEQYGFVNYSKSLQIFCRKHIAYLKRERPQVVQYDSTRIHNEQFPKLFRNHVSYT